MTINNGILITGCQRSGTSLMANLMMAFPNVFVNQTEKHPFDRINSTEKSRDFFVRKTPQFRGVTHLADAKGDFGEHTIEDALNAGYRVIYMLRDGRDVQVSRHKKDPSKYWSQPWKWALSVAEAQLIMKMNHPSFLIVRYEDLVKDPTPTLNKIAEWVDTTPNDISNVHDKVMETSEMGLALGTPRPVDQDSIGRWKLPENEARVKEVLEYKHFSTLLKKMGYE